MNPSAVAKAKALKELTVMIKTFSCGDFPQIFAYANYSLSRAKSLAYAYCR